MTTPWRVIKDQLIADGAMDEQHVTRTPKARHCRHCGRAVIAAITDDGFTVAVEPTPTTPAGELHTLMNGGKTFTVKTDAVILRTWWRIKSADANSEPVHAKHQCDKAPPEIHPSHTAKKAIKEWREGDPIPF